MTKENLRGYLIDVQHYSVHDGDGIRTTIFFAGCNMRCQWCANPESFTTFDKILHTESSCIQCGRCVQACPYGVGTNLSDPEERKKCRSCSRCVPVCPTGSRRSAIRATTVASLVEEIEKYRLFYRHSGGGVTFSGGEASGQRPFLDALSEALYDKGMDLCLESNGDFAYHPMKPVLDRLSLCFIDMKHIDPQMHRKWTGAAPDRTWDTIQKIGASDLPLVIRVPLIAGVNASFEVLEPIADFVLQHVPRPRMELLPYHTYGEVKYRALGMRQPSRKFATPSWEQIQALENRLREKGIHVEHFG